MVGGSQFRRQSTLYINRLYIYSVARDIVLNIDPADLRIFGCVAEARSFRAAASKLGIARSSVSKRISAFEQHIGVTLLHRNTRNISLTDAGQILYRHWLKIADDIDKAYLTVRDLDARTTGTLRVSVPSSLGAALLPPLMRDFQRAWPSLRLSLDFREQHVDVIGKGFDVVIRFAHRLPDSRLIGKRLATTPGILVASPGYLSQFDAPRRLCELRDHRCLAVGYRADSKIVWSFRNQEGLEEIRLTPYFSANNDLAVILAACLDSGILYVPELLVASELRLGRLQRIELDDVTGRAYGVHALYPQSRPPSKVKVFVDFISERLAGLADNDRWAPLSSREADCDEVR